MFTYSFILHFVNLRNHKSRMKFKWLPLSARDCCLGVAVFTWAGCWCLLLPGCEGASQWSHRWPLHEGALDAAPPSPIWGTCPSAPLNWCISTALAQDTLPSYKKGCNKQLGWHLSVSLTQFVTWFFSTRDRGVYCYERLDLGFAHSALSTGWVHVCLSLTGECWWLQFFTIEMTSAL